MISSRHSEDAAKHPHLRGINLYLAGHLHCPAFAPIRQSRSDNGLVYICFEYDGIFRSYNTPVNFLQLDHADCTRRSTSLSMVPSLSITDPRYLQWSTLFSSSPFSVIGNGFFATVILIPLSVKTFCHDSTLF